MVGVWDEKSWIGYGEGVTTGWGDWPEGVTTGWGDGIGQVHGGEVT